MHRSATLTSPASWADLWTETDNPADPREFAGRGHGDDAPDVARHRDATPAEPARTPPGRREQAWSTPRLCDEHGESIRVLDPVLRAFGGRGTYAGRALTVSCPQDSALLAELVQAPGGGRVLVVDGGEGLQRPVMGGAMARRAADNGWAGVIVHGAVRDVDVLQGTDLGVHAVAAVPATPRLDGTGSIGVPVTVGGVTVHPGDHVYADADGIVVSEGPCV